MLRRISLSFLAALVLGGLLVGESLAGASCSAASGGIGGTGAPARGSGIGGTGSPAMAGGIGGTGLQASLAGKVLFVDGQAEAQTRGQTRLLAKGSPVCAGDTLHTGKGALVQVSMEDGGTILLYPDSQLTFETFVYNGVQDGRERNVLALLKGGFRAVTGAVGQLHKEAYAIRTTNATVSIRGTDHETFFVPAVAPGQPAAAQPGTYNHVISGATTLHTGQGNVFIGPNQTGFAALDGSPPLLLDAPPPLKRSTVEKRDKRTESPEESPSAAEKVKQLIDIERQIEKDAKPSEIIQPVRLGNGAVDLQAPLSGVSTASGSAVVGVHMDSEILAVGGVQAGLAGQTLILNDSGLPSIYSSDGTNFNYLANDAPLIDYGTAVVDGVNVKWGVYAGGVTFDPSGNATSVDFHHFAFAGSTTPPEVISALGGVATFSNIVGYSQPTTELGGIGGSVTSLTVNITLGANAAVTGYNLGVTDAHARNWTGVFNGNVGLSTFAQSGVPLTVTCAGAPCGSGVGSGNAVGVLVGPNAKGFISSYGLSTTTGQAVAGAVVMSRP